MIIITPHPDRLEDPDFKDIVGYDDGLEEIRIFNAKQAYCYAYDVIIGRWPEGEEVIKNDPEYAYRYAYGVIRGRWPEGEEAIKNDPEYAYRYARDVIRGRWPEGEEAIKNDPEWAYCYAYYVIRGRWPEGEEVIKSSPEYAYCYAYNVMPIMLCPKENIMNELLLLKRRAKSFCDAHGLKYNYSESYGGFIGIGQSGFWVSDASPDEVQSILEDCLTEHKKFEQVVWEPGLLYKALHDIDDPIKSAIEDELGDVFDKKTLDKIARIFYKYTAG